MTPKLSASTDGSDDPFSAAFAVWSQSVTRSWPAGFLWPGALPIPQSFFDPAAMLRSMMELQGQCVRAWLHLLDLQFSELVEVPEAPSGAPGGEAPSAPVSSHAAAPAHLPTVVPMKPRSAKAVPAAPAIDPASLFDDDLVEKTPPPALAAADGRADDLQAIKGVGPKLRQLLNDLGIYHYRQIAAWTPGEVAWINAKIDFKGRVQRESWVAQARSLTKD